MNFKDIIPPEDWPAFEKGMHGQMMGFGQKPAIIVVDMTYAFVDPSHSLASGNMAMDAVKSTKILIEKARKKKIPIFYTKGLPRSGHLAEFISRKRANPKILEKPRANDIIDEIAPEPEDIIIEKTKASAFFGTNLECILNYYHIDTTIITGISTSGCVRATVVDAASYNYYVIVPEECVADRAKSVHKFSLFDMHMKYADIIPLVDVISYIEAL